MNGAGECDRGGIGMLTSVERRVQAEAKFAQADRGGGHPTEAWLILASKMRRLEAQLKSSDQQS